MILKISKLSDNNSNVVQNTHEDKPVQLKEDKIPSESKTKTTHLLKTTVDTTGRHSMEAGFVQSIFKGYLKNMTKSFKNIYNRLNEVSYHITKG